MSVYVVGRVRESKEKFLYHQKAEKDSWKEKSSQRILNSWDKCGIASIEHLVEVTAIHWVYQIMNQETTATT